MKTVVLGSTTIKLTFDAVTANVESELKAECPYCGQVGCTYSCDESTADTSDDQTDRIQFNAAIDTIESFVLAAACAGVDVESIEFLTALQTTLDAIANNFPLD